MPVEMAIGSSVTARLSLPSSPSTSSTHKPSLFKPQLRPISLSLPTSTTISLLALFSPPYEAKALTIAKDQIVSSLTEVRCRTTTVFALDGQVFSFTKLKSLNVQNNVVDAGCGVSSNSWDTHLLKCHGGSKFLTFNWFKVEKTIDQVQEVGSSFLDATQRVFGIVSDALKPGVDVALPILKQAGELALNVASPAISEASKIAQEAIQSTGIDTEPVLSAAKTVAGAAQQTTKVIEDAKPIASSTVETISSADPVVIIGTAGASFLAYLLLPPLWSAISFNLRGYKGDLTPAQSLDVISTTNYVMIDIRSEKDKDKNGIPRLPSSAKNKMIAVPLEELPSKLKGLVRNVKKLEAEIAALKISYLKKINKGSKIVIMDSYSDAAKIVARTLTSYGFKNCWIVADGFSGRRGWMQSRLGTDSFNFPIAQVLSPSRIIPAAARSIGASSSRLLPGAD